MLTFWAAIACSTRHAGGVLGRFSCAGTVLVVVVVGARVERGTFLAGVIGRAQT